MAHTEMFPVKKDFGDFNWVLAQEDVATRSVNVIVEGSNGGRVSLRKGVTCSYQTTAGRQNSKAGPEGITCMLRVIKSYHMGT